MAYKGHNVRGFARSALAVIGWFACVFALTTDVRSQDKTPTVAELVGNYRYAGDRVKQEKAIAAQVDEATSKMSRIVLKRATPRLAEGTTIRERLQISRSGGNILFKADGHAISVPIDGVEVNAETPRGERAKASFDAKGATLSLTTVGRRTDTYRFNGSGQLVIRVKLTNSRLARPIEYATVYNRAQ